MLEQALDEYFENARQLGPQEGRREGQVESLRKVLLQLMTQRFGHLPKTVRTRVEQITSVQELEKLTRKVLTAKSLEAMGLG